MEIPYNSGGMLEEERISGCMTAGSQVGEQLKDDSG